MKRIKFKLIFFIIIIFFFLYNEPMLFLKRQKIDIIFFNFYILNLNG